MRPRRQPRPSATAPTVDAGLEHDRAIGRGVPRHQRGLPEGATNAPPMKLPRACTGAEYAPADRRVKSSPISAENPARSRSCGSPETVLFSGRDAVARVPGRADRGPALQARRGRVRDRRGVGLPDLRAGHARVAPARAAVGRTARAGTLEDLGSNNGTYVNGVRLQQPTPIRHDDEIMIANNRIRVEARDATQRAASSPRATRSRSSTSARRR